MLSEEILTGHPSVSWKTELVDVIDDINKQFRCSGDACNLISEGTKVRYLLDYPIDYLTKKKIGSKFRETDIRWSIGDHVVTRILLKTKPASDVYH